MMQSQKFYEMFVMRLSEVSALGNWIRFLQEIQATAKTAIVRAKDPNSENLISRWLVTMIVSVLFSVTPATAVDRLRFALFPSLVYEYKLVPRTRLSGRVDGDGRIRVVSMRVRIYIDGPPAPRPQEYEVWARERVLFSDELHESE